MSISIESFKIIPERGSWIERKKRPRKNYNCLQFKNAVYLIEIG